MPVINLTTLETTLAGTQRRGSGVGMYFFFGIGGGFKKRKQLIVVTKKIHHRYNYDSARWNQYYRKYV